MIWDGASDCFINTNTLMTKIAHTQFLLLGEIHTNPNHHRLHALVLARLIKMNRRPAVCLEMLETTCHPKIDSYLASKSPSINGFGKAVEWDLQWSSGFSLYKPIFQVAILARLKIVAANYPKSAVKRVVSEGVSALPKKVISSLPEFSRPFPEKYHKALTEELWDSHFGNAGKNRKEFKGLLDGMALAQRLRDSAMASALLKSGKNSGAVLIAGNGHIRNDRGVPYYLRHSVPSSAIVSIGFIEKNDFRSEFPYNYVWFTK